MLHYNFGAASWYDTGSVLDLETVRVTKLDARTTAVLCKCHEATQSNHTARCPKRPKRPPSDLTLCSSITQKTIVNQP